MLESITRRGFLARAAALVAGLAVGLPARETFAARKRVAVFVLDPLGPDGCAGCASCRACRLHGANKLFASEEAADLHRAHPKCDCAVRRAGDLPTPVWFALFGPTHASGKVGVVDRRHERVASLLAPLASDLS